MDQVKIGKFIAQRRKEKNMTQAELAEKLNITEQNKENIQRVQIISQKKIDIT